MASDFSNSAATAVKVTLDGEELKAVDEDGTKFDVGAYDGKTIAWADNWGTLTAVSEGSGAGQIKIDEFGDSHVYTVDSSHKNKLTGEINLFTCYSVIGGNKSTPDTWKIGEEYDAKTGSIKVGSDVNPTTGKLYKVGEAPMVYLENIETGKVNDWRWAEDMGVIGDFQGTGYKVWAVKVDRNIKADSFEAASIETTADLKLDLDGAVNVGDSTTVKYVAGLTFADLDQVKDVKLTISKEASEKGVKGSIQWLVEEDSADNENKIGVMFKNEGDAQIAADTAFGNLVITLANGRVVTISITT